MKLFASDNLKSSVKLGKKTVLPVGRGFLSPFCSLLEREVGLPCRLGAADGTPESEQDPTRSASFVPGDVSRHQIPA